MSNMSVRWKRISIEWIMEMFCMRLNATKFRTAFMFIGRDEDVYK